MIYGEGVEKDVYEGWRKRESGKESQTDRGGILEGSHM